MANTVIGKILGISKMETIQSKSGSQFTKQSVFLDNSRYDQETGEKYENNLLLDFINYKDGDLNDRFKKGDRVQISFRLRGYSFESKNNGGKREYGISVSCYRIEPYGTQQPVQPSQQPQSAPQSAPQPSQPAQPAQSPDADLPF